MEYIAFDCHKRYTWAVVEDEQGQILVVPRCFMWVARS